MWFIKPLSKDLYIEVLNFLEEKCEKFSLVEFTVPSEEVMDHRIQFNELSLKGNIFPLDDSYKISGLKRELYPFFVNGYKTLQWEGTRAGCRNKTDIPVIHYYYCYHSSILPLKRYNNFFEIENKMDISFYSDNKCVLYTTSHKKECVVDLDFFEPLIKQGKLEIDK